MELFALTKLSTKAMLHDHPTRAMTAMSLNDAVDRCCARRLSVFACAVLMLALVPPVQAQGLAMQMVSDAHTEEMRAFRLTPAYRSNAGALGKRVDVRLDGVSRHEALEHIAGLGGFRLAFSRDVVSLGGTVSLRLENVTVLEALQEATRDSGLQLQLSPSGQVIVQRAIKPLPPPTLRAVQVRQGTIAGVVIEAGTEEPLPGVNVVVEGTMQGASTDADGRYEIGGIEPGTYEVRASYIGYGDEVHEGVEVFAGEVTEVDFVLQPGTLGLDEVVVVGYGEQQRRDLTGAVSSVEEEVLERIPIASVEQGLQGRVAGVQITSSGGEPGGGVRIRIRGAGSINAGNEPLYVIDGMPIDNGGSVGGNAANNRSPRNPLNALNPQDIASVEVLKDASATAIYGARGANGVVLITTKKGRAGALEVSYDGYGGVQEVARTINVLNAQEYMTVLNELRAAQDLDPLFSPEEMVEVGEGTDWQDEIFDPAPIQNHQLSFRGGGGSTHYYASFGYFSQNGIVKKSGMDRYTARLNLSQEAAERFRFGINLNVSYLRDQFAPIGFGENINAGVINSALQVMPTLPVYDQDGNFADPDNDINNPVALLNGIDDVAKTNRTFGNLYGEYEVLDGLRARLNLGTDRRSVRQDTYDSRLTILGNAAAGSAEVFSNNRSTNLGEFTLTYDRDLAERHHLTVLGGVTYQVFTGDWFGAFTEGFPSDVTGTDNLALGENFLRPNSGRWQNQLLSYLGRLNYDYDSRYLATVAFRADGSSRFGENEKFGYFPSVALGWRLSQEPFLRDLGWLDDLKLRLSYGITGNQEIGNYNSLVLLRSSGTAVVGGAPVIGTEPSRVANPDLKWEQTTQYNAGLDLTVFGGRLRGTAEYFVKDTDDLLLSFPLPPSTGFGSVIRNAGSVRNQGFELALNTVNLEGPVDWTSQLTFSTVRNEVTDLAGASEVIPGSGTAFVPGFTIIREGEPINAYYGFKVEGIVQQGETVAAQPDARPGDFKILDANGDGVINDDDRVILGTPFPAFTFGIGSTLAYRNLSLSFFIQGVQGQSLFNINWGFSDNPINFVRNRFAEPYLNRWTPANPTNEHPSGIEPTAYAGNMVNSRAVEDASYIRLQNVTLSYDLPVARLGYLSRANLYVTGRNLITWTDYFGYNPDVSTRGDSNVLVDFNAYPLARTYTLGLSVGF